MNKLNQLALMDHSFNFRYLISATSIFLMIYGFILLLQTMRQHSKKNPESGTSKSIIERMTSLEGFSAISIFLFAAIWLFIGVELYSKKPVDSSLTRILEIYIVFGHLYKDLHTNLVYLVILLLLSSIFLKFHSITTAMASKIDIVLLNIFFIFYIYNDGLSDNYTRIACLIVFDIIAACVYYCASKKKNVYIFKKKHKTCEMIFCNLFRIVPFSLFTGFIYGLAYNLVLPAITATNNSVVSTYYSKADKTVLNYDSLFSYAFYIFAIVWTLEFLFYLNKAYIISVVNIYDKNRKLETKEKIVLPSIKIALESAPFLCSLSFVYSVYTVAIDLIVHVSENYFDNWGKLIKKEDTGFIEFILFYLAMIPGCIAFFFLNISKEMHFLFNEPFIAIIGLFGKVGLENVIKPRKMNQIASCRSSFKQKFATSLYSRHLKNALLPSSCLWVFTMLDPIILRLTPYRNEIYDSTLNAVFEGLFNSYFIAICFVGYIIVDSINSTYLSRRIYSDEELSKFMPYEIYYKTLDENQDDHIDNSMDKIKKFY